MSDQTTFSLDMFRRNMSQDIWSARKYLFSFAKSLSFIDLKKFYNELPIDVRVESIKDKVLLFIKAKEYEEAARCIKSELSILTIVDSDFICNILSVLGQQNINTHYLWTHSAHIIHDDHLSLVCRTANSLSTNTYSFDATAILRILRARKFPCIYSGNFQITCSLCHWPTSSKCLECGKPTCYLCAENHIPCNRDKYCFAVDLNEDTRIELPFSWSGVYYPGTISLSEKYSEIGILSLEGDKLIACDTASHKLVHIFNKATHGKYTVYGRTDTVDGKDYIALLESGFQVDFDRLSEHATSLSRIGSEISTNSAYIAICPSHVRELLPKEIDVSRVRSSVTWDTDILIFLRKPIHYKYVPSFHGYLLAT